MAASKKPNPSIRAKVTRPDTGPKSQTGAEAAALIPDPSPPDASNSHYVLAGLVPGPYARDPNDGTKLVHEPTWEKNGTNPYSREAT